MSDIMFEHLTKTYPNGFISVDDVTLKIQDGEFVVFHGPSGCGKSTILRMIGGLEDITSGNIPSSLLMRKMSLSISVSARIQSVHGSKKENSRFTGLANDINSKSPKLMNGCVKGKFRTEHQNEG